ncbi:competence protein ComFA [Alkalibacterium subtropicum]|uniref:Competence protein ComFA n=1 Tax=Alkalibacterium subtropicum TaxID=753702 RepID=A0A1I1HYT9_9LACT|nr:DEAD/DEAH box helicase family protein [Alkalibacterium subtropicum]SFC29094.1 competence protein ComFA [Alkalibacterium subtropicum]
MIDYSLFYGRSLLKEELPFKLTEEITGKLKKAPAFVTVNGEKVCARCASVSTVSRRYPCTCGGTCLYCRECIGLGKVRECAMLYTLTDPRQFVSFDKPCLKWEGQLSAQQSEASSQVIESILAYTETILWAVAGAGKTEMLFRGIQEALEDNKRVCIASPRVDVCLELAPRIHDAFPDVPLAVLYGGAEESYRYTQLVIATTHQLYRFDDAFDVLIIDEVDAFPYHLNQALLFAADKARRKPSCLIHLTATPDRCMQKRISSGEIKAVILPARYHGFALPVPEGVYHKSTLVNESQAEKTVLIRHMQQLVDQKQTFLLFLPTIALMGKLEPILKSIFSEVSFECVHSRDILRKEKVKKMRDGELIFLVTTTILERGVTFENIDVLVWEADHAVFTEAALVQIAGRAGRSKNHPDGKVTFYHHGWTKAMKAAVKQIKRMNHLARRRGLIR